MVDVNKKETEVKNVTSAFKLKFSWGQQECKYHRPNGEVFDFVKNTLYREYESPKTQEETLANEGYKVILAMSNNTRFRMFDKVSI